MTWLSSLTAWDAGHGCGRGPVVWLVMVVAVMVWLCGGHGVVVVVVVWSWSWSCANRLPKDQNQDQKRPDQQSSLLDFEILRPQKDWFK